MLASDYDFSKTEVDQVEAMAESGGKIPPGYYRCKLEEGCEATLKRDSGDRIGFEAKYIILDGPFQGQIIKDSIAYPTQDEINDGKANQFINRALKLGLLIRDPKTNQPVLAPIDKANPTGPKKQSLGECLGVEVIVEIETRTYTKDKGTPQATQATFTGPSYAGLYYPDDPKILKKMKEGHKPGTEKSNGVAKPESSPSPTSKKKVSVDDL